MKQGLSLAQTITAGRLLAAAEVKNDESILVHIRWHDCVAIEVRYHRKCYNYKYRKNEYTSLIHYVMFNKYKTFPVLIYIYINTSGNWENEKLCGNTRPERRSVFTQF
jgi:hypothetical protein